MYIIEELDIKAPLGSLLMDILDKKLWFDTEPDRLTIFEREEIKVVNRPSLEGRVEEINRRLMVIFKMPLYDATYPYPGKSDKLIQFLKFLQRKYGGQLKLKKRP